MNLDHLDIRREGRSWAKDEALSRHDELPGRLELIDGKLCWSHEERLQLLAALLEQVGIDGAIGLGRLETWRQAVAAASLAHASSRIGAQEAALAARSWNYRVVQHADEIEPWSAIHEVHYGAGRPVSYAEHPASVLWTEEDG